MKDKNGVFERHYDELTSMLPDHDFDFYNDGDPPDKEDDWKVFTAYVAAKEGNSLTMVRKDDSQREERISKWVNKGVPNVNVEVAPKNVKPREHTLAVCDVVLVLNIAPKSVVFDAAKPGDLGPMKDGANFKQFQILQGVWTVPDKGSFRPILRPERLQNETTAIFDRAGMAKFIADRRFDEVVVKSQGQIELEHDFVTGWAPNGDVTGTFKIYEKQPMAQMPKTIEPSREAVEEMLDYSFGKA
mgnify:CR=1 FL=1